MNPAGVQPMGQIGYLPPAQSAGIQPMGQIGYQPPSQSGGIQPMGQIGYQPPAQSAGIQPMGQIGYQPVPQAGQSLPTGTVPSQQPSGIQRSGPYTDLASQLAQGYQPNPGFGGVLSGMYGQGATQQLPPIPGSHRPWTPFQPPYTTQTPVTPMQTQPSSPTPTTPSVQQRPSRGVGYFGMSGPLGGYSAQPTPAQMSGLLTGFGWNQGQIPKISPSQIPGLLGGFNTRQTPMTTPSVQQPAQTASGNVTGSSPTIGSRPSGSPFGPAGIGEVFSRGTGISSLLDSSLGFGNRSGTQMQQLNPFIGSMSNMMGSRGGI